MQTLPLFKAYDLRGEMPHELNPTIAFHVGAALANCQPHAKTVILGMDSRTTSPELLSALAAGLVSQGLTCQSLGLCGTEEVYHALGTGQADVGLMVTASHNPIQFNGVKPVHHGGRPFAPEELHAWEAATRARLATNAPTPATFPAVPTTSHRAAYVQHLLGLVNLADIPAQTIVINAGNGAAGPTVDALLAHLPQLTVHRLHHTPDGTFPNGIPNPLLPANRTSTQAAVLAHGASIGIAWDGDFDRCFFYDETGQFISSYYITTLLAQATLAQHPGSTIVQDPRLNWATTQTVQAAGGHAITGRVGHSFIKPLMRKYNSPFAGEVSGHYYFRDFFYCDSGMLPWLLLLSLLGRQGQSLGQAVAQLQATFPASEETNFHTPIPAKAFLQQLTPQLQALAPETLTIDGLSLENQPAGWRANLRGSSTEPLLRLNVEATSPTTLANQLEALTSLLTHTGATVADGTAH